MNNTVTLPVGFGAEIEVTFKGNMDERERTQFLGAITSAVILTKRKELYRNRNNAEFTGIAAMIDIVMDPSMQPDTAWIVTPLSPQTMQHLQRQPLALSELPNHVVSELHHHLIRIANVGAE